MRLNPPPLPQVASSCMNNVAMADWQRLADRILTRRIELGYAKRPALAEASGRISLRTLSSLETASRTNYDRNTIAALEHALQWAPGSVTAIIDGGEPTPLTAAPAASGPPTATATPDDDPVLRILNSTASPAQKEEIVKRLLAEQRAFAQRRVDELLNEALGTQQTPG
jgi:hypothetical protein